ncbi:MAG TPA: hypothetical protein VIE86_07705 [Nitrososphaera sp.]|jgi:hypothetical protein
MLTKAVGTKGTSSHYDPSFRSYDVDRNKFLSILIRRQKKELDKIVAELAEKNNPTLLSIKKVENLFIEHTEFDSRTHLLRQLNGSMKATVLNTIIAHLVSENKIVVNDDHSLTWVDSQGNIRLNEEFGKAVSL